MIERPVVYVRGYAGSTSGIDEQVEDPFYGFNKGATHVRADGDGDPMFYQFEGPLLRLITEHGYHLQVHGDQRRLLDDPSATIEKKSIWVHRFYDQAATSFHPAPHENVLHKMFDWARHHVSAEGYNIETAAGELYDLIEKVRARSGADKVYLVAHSMGGLVARCMIQKLCGQEPAKKADDESDAKREPRRAAKDIVAKLFTYGTPHGGIATDLAGVNKAMELFGPAGSDVFSPPVMHSYLTPGKVFGDTDDVREDWDARVIPPDAFDADDVFCIVGTDPADYGPSRLVVGPKSDGLVRIENAYVKGAHRAFIYKSHSGSYGEVNSEEGYQNLRRFLFGRYHVQLSFGGLSAGPFEDGVSWQADMRLAIRGLPIIMSEQRADHWCPIILNKEAKRGPDTVDAPVPIVSTFLFHPEPEQSGRPVGEAARYARHVLNLRVYPIVQKHGAFDFRDHLEGIADWVDSLVVDIGLDEKGSPAAWTGWNSEIKDSLADTPRMPNPLELGETAHDERTADVLLPSIATGLPIFSRDARLHVTVRDRGVEYAP